MKVERQLSGVFIRVQEDNGKWVSKCFEDCTEVQQKDFLSEKDVEWVKSLVMILSNTLNEIGEFTDVSKNSEERD